MPNLMLTNYCNYKCNYCFGVDMMFPKVSKSFMSKETFMDIMKWLERKPFDNIIHLMGGEPTLNPHIEWMIDYLLEKEYNIQIFSNLATKQAVKLAEKLNVLPIKWIANVNNPNKWTKIQKQNIEQALSLLNNKASLTFNIIPDQNEDYWSLNLIEKFNLDNIIKVGFILPTLTSSNMALKDNEYECVAEKVVNLVKNGERINLKVEFECGVPYCAFNEEQLGFLYKNGSNVKSGCCSRLDITPDGYVIYCLPLATAAKKHFSQFDDYNNCRMWFERIFSSYRMIGSQIKCSECLLNQEGECRTGCLAKNLIGVRNFKIEAHNNEIL